MSSTSVFDVAIFDDAVFDCPAPLTYNLKSKIVETKVKGNSVYHKFKSWQEWVQICP